MLIKTKIMTNLSINIIYFFKNLAEDAKKATKPAILVFGEVAKML